MLSDLPGDWTLSSSSAPGALDVVDGRGQWAGEGPHYSRRSPGSKTFTGVGQEVVLLTADRSAVWATVRQRTPAARGSGNSRGRSGTTDERAKYVWRNMLFRNLGSTLSSRLILSATAATYQAWPQRYGALPVETLRTEVDPKMTRSKNPGFCYKMAGYHSARAVRGKVYLDAPCSCLLLTGECSCCPGSLLQGQAPCWDGLSKVVSPL